MTTEISGGPNLLRANGRFDPSAELTEFRLEDGRMFRVPTAVLVEANPVSTAESNALSDRTGFGHSIRSEEISIPIVEEHLIVDKQVVPTSTVRLHKSVQQFETALNEPLAVRAFDVERVVLNRPVDTAPDVRHEGETTVYPVVEEQLILTKQLILKEEVRVTKRDTERIDTQTVTLRREHIEVEREPAP